MPQIDYNRLARSFEDNPAAVIGTLAALLMGLGKIVDSVGQYRGSSAYAKQVKYRIRNKK